MKVRKPCGHRVLVRLKEVEEVSKGGIVIASSEKELNRQKYGTEEAYIEQIGSQAFKGFCDGEPWCEVGDLVAIVKYSAKTYEDNGVIYGVCNDEDILACLEDGEDHE